MEGREPFPCRDKRERMRVGLKECSNGFAQEENLSGSWTGGQEVLSVAVDLLWSRAVACAPGEEGTGIPGVYWGRV